MSILSDLGLDPETLKWQDLAACNNMDPNLFYDRYEEDEIIAKQIDEVCLRCPVMAACAKAGQTNKEEGVWGGIYWNGSGKPDKIRNKHKSVETWQRIQVKLSV